MDANSINIVCNTTGEGLCAQSNPVDRRSLDSLQNDIAKRQDSTDADVIVDGEIVAPEFVNSYCGYDAAPTDPTTATGAEQLTETGND